MKLRTSLVMLGMVLGLSSFSVCTVLAAPEPATDTQDTPDEPVVTSILDEKEGEDAPILTIIEEKVETENGESSILTFTSDGKTPLFNVESPEYVYFQQKVTESVTQDAIDGFNLCLNNTVTLDHIRMDDWGEFINKYSGKAITMFPTGNIKIKCKGYSFELKNTAPARILVKDYILPTLDAAIRDVAQQYPLYRYALDIPSGQLLKDYEFDMNSIRLVNTVYPLDGIENLYTYDTGTYYGLNLSNDYISILRGYIEGVEGSTGYNRSVKGSQPGSVDVRASVVTLKDVSDFTLEGKSSAAYEGYSDLAVNLSTKELVDLRNISTTNTLNYSEYHINPENLILVPTTDTVVVLQPTYLECFRYKRGNLTLNKTMGRTLDCTTFATTGEKVFTVVGTNETVPLEKFVNENGIIGTEIGNAPFLVYYDPNNLDYKRIVEWMYSRNTTIDSATREALLASLKSKFKEENKLGELNGYLQSVGQMTDNTKSMIGLFVMLGILALIVVLMVMSKLRSKRSNVDKNTSGDILFKEDEDNMFDDDDDDDDSFQFM